MEDKLNKSSFTFDIKSIQPALLLLSSSILVKTDLCSYEGIGKNTNSALL